MSFSDTTYHNSESLLRWGETFNIIKLKTEITVGVSEMDHCLNLDEIFDIRET